MPRLKFKHTHPPSGQILCDPRRGALSSGGMVHTAGLRRQYRPMLDSVSIQRSIGVAEVGLDRGRVTG